MKLFHTHASPLRIWLGMLLLGCIVGVLLAVLLLGLFFLRTGDFWFHPLWVTGGVLGFAIFLAFKCAPIEIRVRKEEREAAAMTPGHHPQFGDFEAKPFINQWTAFRVLPSGCSVEIGGSGPAPTDKDVDLWRRAAAQIVPLTEAVEKHLLPLLPTQSSHAELRLVPNRVSFTGNGGIEIAFDTAPSAVADDLRLIPVATFGPDLKLRLAEWECY